MRPLPPAIVATCLLSLPLLARAETPAFTFTGSAPTDSSEFFDLPFQVPAGTVEIEVDHQSLTSGDTLDWGVQDQANNFRGWGGGNTEAAVIDADRASRSYLTGPITPGTWRVLVGKAQIVTTPANYHVDIYLRTTTTLAPQPERRPYKDAPAISSKAGWYAGDLHVHSEQSGDSQATIEQIAALAATQHLDWLELSEHNTTSQLDYLGSYQDMYPNLLFVPGVEYTTYHGHANGIGATQFVDHTVGYNGVTIEGAAQAFAAQGAVFSPNHPLLNLPSLCIGCGWSYSLPPTTTASFEIASGGWDAAGQLFDVPVIAQWDTMLATGAHVAPVGGSDDHRAGIDLAEFGSPIGNPTTMVYAQNLSAPAIIAGIKQGRTAVKLDGPSDPMASITTDDGHMIGDTVDGSTTLHVLVTGGSGSQVQLVHNGDPTPPINVTSDPFTWNVPIKAPSSGQDRYRAQVFTGGHVSTVTSHIWVAPAVAKKQSCGSDSTGVIGLGTLLTAALIRLRRRAA